MSLGAGKRGEHDGRQGATSEGSEKGEDVNHYCDVWFWRASDQAAVARHLADRRHAHGDTGEPACPGLIRSALRSLLRVVGLAGQPVEARPVMELPAREDCDCDDGEFGYREPVLDDGEWALRCLACGHLDRLGWLSDEARPLVLGLARRRWLLRTRKVLKP